MCTYDCLVRLQLLVNGDCRRSYVREPECTTSRGLIGIPGILICADVERVGINLLVELELSQLDHPLRQKRSVLCINTQLNLDDVRQSQLAFLFEQRKLFDHVIARLCFLHIAVTSCSRGGRNHAVELGLNMPKRILLKEEFDF